MSYFTNNCPWPGRDPPCHYVRFSYDGSNSLQIGVRYASVPVRGDQIEALQESTLELPPGNIEVALNNVGCIMLMLMLVKCFLYQK